MKGAAAEYLQEMSGLPLIPVGQNKRPLDGKEWNKRPKTAEQVAAMNGNCSMCGLLLDGQFVAVDVDGPAVMPWVLETYGADLSLLPQTWAVTSGREGRLAFIYRQPSDDQLQRLADAGAKVKNERLDTQQPIPDPEHAPSDANDKTQALEVRFNGQQVVIGQHPSPEGLEYKWLGHCGPESIAAFPDLIVDVLVAHAAQDPAAQRRKSKQQKSKKEKFSSLPDATEATWWDLSAGERLDRLANRWLPAQFAADEQKWFHACSLIKAVADEHELDEDAAFQAFLRFSKRAPKFQGADDCLNKWGSTEAGAFEDPLGFLVKVAQDDGGLVLPPKPAAAESASGDQPQKQQKQQQLDIDQVTEYLKASIDEGADAAVMAQLTMELAAASPFSQAAIKEIAKRLQEQDDAEQDRVARKAALANTAEIEAEFKALKLEEFLPERIATALRQAGEGMPYSDFTMLFSYLLAASSSVKLGTKVCANRVTDFVVPMNLYLAEAGESGSKKTPKTIRFLKRPTAAVRSLVQEQSRAMVIAFERLPRKAKVGQKKPVMTYLHVDSFTGEAVCEKLQQSARHAWPMLVYREELKAVFDGLGIYKQGRGQGSSGGDEELILELHDGHEHTTIRVGGDRYFPEAHVSLGGCVQQGVLSKLLASDDHNGKWARVLFYPLEKAVVALPDDSHLEEEENSSGSAADRVLRETINGLFSLKSKTYFLEKAASVWFRNYEEQKQREAIVRSEPSLRALFGKSAGKVPRIAGLLMMLEHVDQVGDLKDPDVAIQGEEGLEDADMNRRKIQVKHLEAAARLVELSDRWVSSFHDSIAAGGHGETVSAVDALEARLQTIAIKCGDWQSWKTIKENLTPTQRKELNAERGKSLLRGMAEKGLGEIKLGDRGGLLYRAVVGEGG